MGLLLRFVPIAAVVVLPLTYLHQAVALRAVLLVPVGFLALRAPRDLWRFVVRSPIGVLLALTATTVVWSENPRETVLGVGALVLETLAALAVFGVAGPHGRRYVAAVLGLLLAVSVVVAVVEPAAGQMLHTSGQPWRGIFVHKNSLGTVAAFSFVIFAGIERLRWRPAWLALALWCLWMSQSAGALVAALVGGGVLLTARVAYVRLDRERGRSFTVFYMLLLAGGYATWSLFDSITHLLDREATLTGRTEVWTAAIEYGSAHRWFGTGISAQIYPGSRLAESIAALRNQALGTTHSGYLALYLGAGLLGLGVLTIALIFFLVHVERARRGAVPTAVVALGLGLTFCYLALNLVEDRLLTRSGWFFLLFGMLQLVDTRIRLGPELPNAAHVTSDLATGPSPLRAMADGAA